MVPAKLQWHLQAVHVHCKDKLITFSKRKCDEMKHSEINLTSVIKDENGNVY
jgi:spore maturation protein CgeB